MQTTALTRLPPWVAGRVGILGTGDALRRRLRRGGLVTVCEQARCPNLGECFQRGTATFMLLGGTCTRRCGFCSVATGRPTVVDPTEAERVAEAAAELELDYVVLTMVARDDLPDEGAAHVASAIRTLHQRTPGIKVEVLTSDFSGRKALIAKVLDARPEVFAHNVETVERLTPSVRGRARYGRSLGVLASAARWLAARGGGCVKTGIMVGLGESREELRTTLKEIRTTGCSLLTVGQYLRPTRDSLAVERYLRPDEFEEIAEEARELGFAEVASGPLVRSSYRADGLFAAAQDGRMRAAE